ncbi:MAG: hypothetical protein FJ042_03840 [Candidatus Cloacimonetes bacterium]|nr:hypothetical protein [Candidatus Cloacimonadota bacterium]
MKYLIILTLALILTSCEVSDPDAAIRMEISNILYEIRTGVIQNDIGRIMLYVDWDYLHFGMRYFQYRELWLDRMGVWTSVTFDNLSVRVNGDQVVASFIMRLTNAAGTTSSFEPDTNGDTSYFLYDGSSWKLIGNQHPF